MIYRLKITVFWLFVIFCLVLLLGPKTSAQKIGLTQNENVSNSTQSTSVGENVWLSLQSFFEDVIVRMFGSGKTDKTSSLQNMSAQSTTSARNTGLNKVSACTCTTRECRECMQDPVTAPSCSSSCPYCGCQGDGSCDYSCDDADGEGENGGGSRGVQQPAIVNPPVCGALGAPSGLNFSCNRLTNSVRLSWAPGTNASYYSLRFKSAENPGDTPCGTTLPGSTLCVDQVGGAEYLIGPAQQPPYNLTLDLSKQYVWWVHSRCGNVSDWRDSPGTVGPNVNCNFVPRANFAANPVYPSTCPSSTPSMSYDLFVTGITPASNNMSSTYMMTFYGSGDSRTPWTQEWKNAVKNYLGTPDYTDYSGGKNDFAYILGFSSATSGNAMGYRLTGDTLVGGAKDGVTRKKLSELISYYSNPHGQKPYLIGANLRVNGVQRDYVGGQFFSLLPTETGCGVPPTSEISLPSYSCANPAKKFVEAVPINFTRVVGSLGEPPVQKSQVFIAKENAASDDLESWGAVGAACLTQGIIQGANGQFCKIDDYTITETGERQVIWLSPTVGKYVVVVNAIHTPGGSAISCSGNPKCPYENPGTATNPFRSYGEGACAGWTSCSNNDWHRFEVVSAQTCTSVVDPANTPTPTVTSSPDTTPIPTATPPVVDPANTPTPTVTSSPDTTPIPTATPPGQACTFTSECPMGEACVSERCSHDGVGGPNDVCRVTGPTPPPYRECGNMLECVGQNSNGEGVCQILVCQGGQLAGCVTPTPSAKPTNTPTATPTPLPVGAVCTETYQCAIGYVCKEDPNQPSVKSCQQGLVLNDVCVLEPADLCGNTYVCDPVSRKCVYRVCTAGVGYGCVTPTPAPSLKSRGDANGDRLINVADFKIWKSEFVGVAGEDVDEDGNVWDADFNADGKVNLVDLWIWLRNKT